MDPGCPLFCLKICSMCQYVQNDFFLGKEYFALLRHICFWVLWGAIASSVFATEVSWCLFCRQINGPLSLYFSWSLFLNICPYYRSASAFSAAYLPGP